MHSSKNLAAMFAQAQRHQPPQQASSGSLADVYHSHHSTSKAVDAQDDSHFENTTFQLKRTRSMGLLDEFIVPTRKLIEEDDVNLPSSQSQIIEPSPQPESQQELEQELKQHITQQPTSLEVDFDDQDDEGQFIENVDDEPSYDATKKKNVIYTYDDDANDYDDDSLYDNTTSSTNNTRNQENKSPSPPSSPDCYQPHDDNDIVYEPSRHVDYLSHNWKEADISKSWRYIVLKRKDVANSARLENASWRTWAQAKYDLKTISPESVNWLKDSDVTWLYGPIYKESSENVDDELEKKYGSDGESSTLNAIKREHKKMPSTTPGSASSPSTKTTRKGYFDKNPPKPILKKRTVSEMLTQPSMIKLAHHHNHTTQQQVHSPQQVPHVPSPPVFEDDFDMISKRVNAQYSKPSVETPVQSSVASVSSKDDPVKRHIHFNDRVEQCIALNYPDTEDEADANDDDEEGYNDGGYDHSGVDDDGVDGDNDNDGSDDDGDDSDESDDEGGFFLNVKSPSSAQLNRDFGLQLDHTPSGDNADDEDDESEEDDSLKSKKSFKIIEWLPSTTLKYGSDDEGEENYAVSHRIDTSRGYNYHYDYNSVFTGNADDYIHLGSNDYQVEDTPQHLEGVDMVDVPENIVLGSNVEMVDTPEDLVSPVFEPQQATQLPRVASHQSGPLQRTSSSGAFSLHSDDSESDSEPEQDPISSSPRSISSIQKGINKVSTSPSYASLSDVAAQGYISQGSPADVGQLQRDFGNLNAGDGHENKGFKAALMNSWKKN